MLCDLCLGLSPTVNQYTHHASFEELLSCAQQCELCKLLSELLEKNGDRKRAEEYRATVDNKHQLVNDTSITISINRHEPPKDSEDVRAPHQLLATCGPIRRQGMFAESDSLKASATVLGIYAEEGTEAANIIATRPVPSSCTSDRAIDLIKAWISNCIQGHDECHLGYMDGKNHVSAHTLKEVTQQLKSLSREEDTPLPTRVLDVMANGQSDQICLLDTARSPGAYIALSHCWGKSAHLTTTQSNLSERQSSIDFNNLSKTFQDAVRITRRLGIRYLWIDALCIVQDDIDDWEKESALMGQVYRNAYLTIAAAYAVDGDGGCLRDRFPSSSHAIRIPLRSSENTLTNSYWYVHETRGNYSTKVWNGPLQQRAWTLQERCLSRRIVHFAEDQMYFECNKSLQFENRKPEAEHSSDYLSFSILYFMAMHENPLYGQMMVFLLARQWSTIIESFTARGLTKEEDALPALSGIGLHLAQICKTGYAAGLWMGPVLPDMLLWRVLKYEKSEGNSRPLNYRAPTWSWASMRGPVLFAQAGTQPLETGHLTSLLDQSDIEVDVQPLGNDPNGRLRSGTLNLRGWLVPITNLGSETMKKFEHSDYSHWASWFGRMQHFKSPHILLTGYSYVRSVNEVFWGAAAFDVLEDVPSDIFALLVKRKELSKSDERKVVGNDEHLASFFVLYISPVADTQQTYRRIGMGQLVQLSKMAIWEKASITII